MPLNKLPFPSIVVASSNDEYVTLERVKHFADNRGSEFFNAGKLDISIHLLILETGLGNFLITKTYLIITDEYPT